MISAPFSSDHQAPRLRKQHAVFGMSFELEVTIKSRMFPENVKHPAVKPPTSGDPLYGEVAGMGSSVVLKNHL